jgi:hypothetical protein
MSSAARRLKSRPGGFLVAVIGDEDTATGFLLAGVGQNDAAQGPNYFVVDPSKFAAHPRAGGCASPCSRPADAARSCRRPICVEHERGDDHGEH